MKKVEVKSNGIVIGYTYNDGKTIDFLDNEESIKVQNKFNSGQPIGISSRRIGTVDENGKCIEGDLNELGIVNVPKSDN